MLHRKNQFFDYDLVDSVRDWRADGFYATNMIPPLAVHSGSGPTVNDCWEMNLLMNYELQAIKPFLERIRTLKQQGLTSFGIVWDGGLWLRKEREHYGFGYSRAEDPSRMVPALELTDEEVLERLQKILKGVSVVPHMVPEYHADNPPPAVSRFTFVSTYLYISFTIGTFGLHFLALIFLLWLFCLFVGIGA
jgi:hypothetical protein